MKTKLLKKLRKEAEQVFRIVPCDGVDVNCLIKYDDKTKKEIELLLERGRLEKLEVYRRANMRTWILKKVKELRTDKE